ncbi:MAG: Uma2 family endonuclease [Thermaceae bacterium]|nr:Uma2 family endonuclease [Thermaceae bacterium]
MVKPVTRLMTIDEYLETELAREVRHEFVHGQIYAMAGVTGKHNRICINITSHFMNLSKDRCHVYQTDVKLRIRREKVYYPDVMGVCQGEPPDEYYETDPCILVEVLSPSTKDIDQREKADAYRSIPSLQTYLIVDTESRTVRCYWLEGQDWQVQDYVDGEIPLPCLEGTIGLEQIYRGVL